MTHCVFAINFFKALKIYGQNALPPHNAGLSLDDPCASVQLNPPRPIQYKKKHLLSPLRTHVRTPIPKLPSRNTYPGYQVSLSTYVRKPLGLSENWLKIIPLFHRVLQGSVIAAESGLETGIKVAYITVLYNKKSHGNKTTSPLSPQNRQVGKASSCEKLGKTRNDSVVRHGNSVPMYLPMYRH